MANFTDTGYDPVAWVNLFAAAGARYMVSEAGGRYLSVLNQN